MILVEIETTHSSSETTFKELTYYVNWDLTDYLEDRITDKDILSDFSGLDYSDEEIETLGFLDGPFEYRVGNVLQMSEEEYEVLCKLDILYDYRDFPKQAMDYKEEE